METVMLVLQLKVKNEEKQNGIKLKVAVIFDKDEWEVNIFQLCFLSLKTEICRSSVINSVVITHQSIIIWLYYITFV